MKYFLFIFLLFISLFAQAHPMPNSILNLDIGEKSIKAEAQMPLSVLITAMKLELGESPENQFDTYKKIIQDYIFNHIKIENWSVSVDEVILNSVNNEINGDYKEVVANITLTPKNVEDLRHFVLNYDVIVHQVVTHEILVSVRNDWNTGVYGENATQIGVINIDIPTNTVKPFEFQRESGSTWKGFVAMFQLGMSHIKEGTDHLLFLLVLLIPAPLFVERRRWSGFVGTKKSIWKLFKIITAFTFGHSVTLLLGTIGWIPFSSRLIEIMIAVSILISAIHAIFPLFFQKETYIAAGFGLIHGLAFSDTLSNMPLSATQMGLSILGFNLGIEAMQLFVMLLILPSLFAICYFSLQNYHYFRIFAAIIAIIAASAWLLERTMNKANIISSFLEKIPDYSLWIVGDLAALAVLSYFLRKREVK